jgi:hypothetical protein
MDLIIGIAIGAAFSKFWISIYQMAKPYVLNFFTTKK